MRNSSIEYSPAFLVAALLLILGAHARADAEKTGSQWHPFLEWSLVSESFSGNPYDIEAVASFRHENGETRRTGLFYAGENTWKFRFTGTLTGEWQFTTSSEDPDLNGQTGTVRIAPNADTKAHGFLTCFGNKWGWQCTETAFVPQLMMYADIPEFAGKPEKIENDIQTFLLEHGFNGFHVAVLTRWFDFDQPRYDEIDSSDPNPDPRTFEALELLITKTHRAGGMVHLWAWGDEQRHMTPAKWGINGKVDRRLQRYLAARLGPLPGWSMGYGFDLDEWVDENDLRVWHAHLHEHFGWPHFLGGRSGGPNHGTDHGGQQIYGGLDYAGYEHHRPDYKVYVAALAANPGKPVFSEDRFRVRDPSPYPEKDYDETQTRRGLWDSTMAGGVANIWGNLVGDDGRYEHPEWIRTWDRFFDARFLKGMQPANAFTDGVCLAARETGSFVFYKEESDTVRMDLSLLEGPRSAIAVDTRRPYEEIDLGSLPATDQVWKAPRISDWAITIGCP